MTSAHIEAARRNLDAAQDRLDSLRRNCDRNAPALREAAARRVWAAAARLQKAERAVMLDRHA